MALKAGYYGIKKFIADKLNRMNPGDSFATDAEIAAAADKVRADIAPVLEEAKAPTGGISAGEQFYLNDILYLATEDIAAGADVVTYPAENYNCKLSDSVTGQIKAVKDGLGTASTKNSTSVVTQSTDLVESGAVENIIGWGNKNFDNPFRVNTQNNVSYTKENNGYHLTMSMAATYGQAYFWYDNLPKNTDITVKCDVDFTSGVGLVVATGCNSLNAGERVNIANSDVISEDKTVELSFNTGNYKYIIIFLSASGGTSIKGEVAYNNYIICRSDLVDKSFEPYHASVEETLTTKTDNSVIAPVENGTNASQAYAVGEHFIRDGAFCTVTSAISANESLVGSSKFTSGNVAETLSCVKGFKLGTFQFSTTTGVSTGNVTFDSPFPSNIDSTRIAVFLSTISDSSDFIFMGSVSNITLNGFSYLLKNISAELEANNRFCMYLAVAY